MADPNKSEENSTVLNQTCFAPVDTHDVNNTQIRKQNMSELNQRKIDDMVPMLYDTVQIAKAAEVINNIVRHGIKWLSNLDNTSCEETQRT